MESATTREPSPERCDECGKRPRRIWRVRLGHRYCGTCYARVFKQGTCPRCEARARLPRNVPGALCIRCERDGPCHRCGRDIERIGRHTPYGPVCNKCVRYYDPPRSCERCEKTSAQIGSYRREGRSTLLCVSCAYPERRTCGACRRHRDVRLVDDGRLLCRRCEEIGLIDCSDCGDSMPAGRINRCWDCDWRARLEKRVRINRRAFAVPAMAAHFEAFGRWLGEEVGVNKAALKINGYLPFFMEIEKRWGHVPDYGALVGHFGTAGLRKVLLPVRWLTSTGLVVVDEKAKQDESLSRQIDVTLARFPGDSRERALLAGYHRILERRRAKGRTSLRSIKGAMTPAAALVAKAVSRGAIVPDQATLDAYLDAAPGQRAAVTGFVNHLREHHNVDLVVPPLDPRRAASRRREVLERDVACLLEQREQGEDIESRWLELALCLFHDTGRQHGRTIVRTASIERCDDGFQLIHDNKTYYVPRPPA